MSRKSLTLYPDKRTIITELKAVRPSLEGVTYPKGVVAPDFFADVPGGGVTLRIPH